MDTLTLTQNESGRTQTVNVSQSGSGGGEILDDCIITVRFVRYGASANAIHVEIDKAPKSNLSVSISASYTRSDGSKTYSGTLTTSFSTGSTAGSVVFFSDLINDSYAWNGEGANIVNSARVSPTKDSYYNYGTRVEEI